MPEQNNTITKHAVPVQLVEEWFLTFLESLGCDSQGHITDTTSFTFVPFDKEEPEAYVVGGQYIIRPYYTGDIDGISDLPNFVNKTNGFEIYWYKQPLRSPFSNVEVTSLEQFKKLVTSND